MARQLAYLPIFLLSLISSIAIIFFYFPIRNIPTPIMIICFVFILSAYVIFYKYHFHDLLKYPPKEKAGMFISSALLALLFLFGSKGKQDYLIDNSSVIMILTYLGSFLLITIMILFITMLVLKSNMNTNFQKVTFNNFAIYFLIILLSGIFYWVAFYPAAMSYDSMWSWNQVHTKEFNDWHPIMFTWFIMFLTFIWDSPAVVTLVQILILALIYAYSFTQLQKLGIKKYVLVFICILIAFSPPFGNYSIIIWKDVLYSGFLLLFSIHLFLIVKSKGGWLNSKGNIALLFMSSFGLVFFRHNGFPVYILTMIILLFLYRKYAFKKTFPIFLIIFIFHQILTGPIFTYLNIESSDPNEALAIPTQQIGNVIKNNGELSSEQLEYFNSILPIQLWKENYYPHTVDYIKFNKEYHRNVITDDYLLYFRMWGETVLQNPKLTIDAFLSQTSLVWQIHIPENAFSLTYYTDLIENDVGLKQKPLSSFLSAGISEYLETSRSNPFINFVWRPASYAFIIFVFSIAFFMKNGWKSVVILSPFLLNMLSVIVALPAQDFRYLFANVLIGFVFPLMALVNPNFKEE